MAISDGELQKMVAMMQVEQSVQLYNTVVQVSFKQCVHSFRSSKLSGKEKECVANAVGKYLKLSGRIQRRVAEVQASQQADFMAKQQAAHDTGVAATPLGTKVT